MKLRSIWAIIPVFTALLFSTACNDNLNSVGNTIQPSDDSIYVATDTITVNAKTISMQDSVYARTINGVLGKYEDDVFGTIQSDYLAQFYFPSDAKFKDNLVSIDSVQFVIDFNSYAGDSLAPMGLSIYKVTSDLTPNFYTNADPSKYSDLSTVLANQAFTINGARKLKSSTTQREIVADLGTAYGTELYQQVKSGEIKDNASFQKKHKGVYVTTTFGSGALINVLYTSIDIYYKYKSIKGNYNQTADTILSTNFSLTVTDEVIQLNHIKNTIPADLLKENTGATYMKTPAGLYTQVVFPLKKIRENMDRLKMKSINSAQFLVNGYTQKESTTSFSLQRPSYFLLIDKDSVDQFFAKKELPNGISSFYTARNTSYNTYDYNNISGLINHYNAKGVDNLTCLLIPVDISLDSSTGAPLGVYNYLKPSTAVLRSDSTNMRLNLIYNKFN